MRDLSIVFVKESVLAHPITLPNGCQHREYDTEALGRTKLNLHAISTSGKFIGGDAKQLKQVVEI